MLEAIGKIFTYNYYDSYRIIDALLVASIGTGYVNIPEPNNQKSSVIKVLRSSDSTGCFVAHFPYPLYFGSGLDKDPAVEHYFGELAILLSNAEHSKLSLVFSKLSELLISDLPVLKDAVKYLSKFIEKYQVFTTSLYFANITNTPIIIEPKAKLIVEGIKSDLDQNNPNLSLMKEVKKDGENIKISIDDPLIIPSGTSIKLFAYTDPITSLDGGGTLSGLFSDKSSNARIKLHADTVGFFSRKIILTPKRPFSYNP